VVELSCGTGCKNFAIVDVSNGNLYSPDIIAEYGAHYDVGSNLFEVNDKDVIYESCYRDPTTIYIGCQNKKPTTDYYVWTGDHLNLIGKYKILYNVKKVK